jgi:hypothetical protein
MFVFSGLLVAACAPAVAGLGPGWFCSLLAGLCVAAGGAGVWSVVAAAAAAEGRGAGAAQEGVGQHSHVVALLAERAAAEKAAQEVDTRGGDAEHSRVS